MRVIFSTACLISMSTVALASGGTSSGGGNTITNRNNPWFLENTKEVRYCIEMDEANFGVSESVAAEAIQNSIAYWKKSFAIADNNGYEEGQLEPYGQLRVATQRFVKTDCNENTDLRFQLGILSPDQIEAIGEPREFVGLAFRTEYDPKELKGKGLIYIAPQSGPLRPTSTYFAEKTWETCEGCALREVLKHELGHVFGLQHSNYGDLDLMDERMPAMFTHNEVLPEIEREAAYIVKHLEKPYFHFEIDSFLFATLDEEAQKIFGLTSNEKILKIVRGNPDNEDDFRFLAGSSQQLPLKEIGKICSEHGRMNSIQVSSSSEYAVVLYYTDEQRVFSRLPDPENEGLGQLSGYEKQTEYEMSAGYCSNDGQIRIPVLLRLDGNGPRLGTVVDGIIDTDFLRDDWRLRNQSK